MICEIDIKAVELFLKSAFKEIKRGNCKFVGKRIIEVDGKFLSQLQALNLIGIYKLKNIWKIILNLKPDECINISRDYDFKKDYNDDMYEFLTEVNNIKTYIKLTINSRGVLCVSFHKSSKIEEVCL